MKNVFVVLAAAAVLTMAGCASNAPVDGGGPVAADPGVVASYEAVEGVVSGPTVEPTIAPVVVDVASSDSFTFEDGLKVTYKGVAVATAEQVGSDPIPGMVPVILSFQYDNEGDAAIPLLQVPLNVTHGANGYATEQPTLYDGDPTHSEIPQQITPGSTVEVVDTYWVPSGEPIDVTVQGTADAEVLLPVLSFTGITAP